jgi:hypothetical protein
VKRWMAAIALSMAGCGTRAVLVEPGVPVRLAEPVEARVLVPDGAGHWVEGQSAVRLPAGWYVLPPPAAAQRAGAH